MQPTPRFADPSKEGILLAGNRLRMIPSSSGGVPDVPYSGTVITASLKIPEKPKIDE